MDIMRAVPLCIVRKHRKEINPKGLRFLNLPHVI